MKHFKEPPSEALNNEQASSRFMSNSDVVLWLMMGLERGVLDLARR